MDELVEPAKRAHRVEALLTRAASRIAASGWVQHRFRGTSGEVCGLQAILDVASAGPYAFDEICDAECRLLDAAAGHAVGARAWPDRPERIVAWNDAHGRTAAEVVAAFESAAHACAMHPEPAWSQLFSELAERIAA